MQLREKQKYEIIFLYERNYTNIKISKEFNINKNTVTKWIERYKNTKYC